MQFIIDAIPKEVPFGIMKSFLATISCCLFASEDDFGRYTTYTFDIEHGLCMDLTPKQCCR